jgi:hypothetical protein
MDTPLEVLRLAEQLRRTLYLPVRSKPAPWVNGLEQAAVIFAPFCGQRSPVGV